MAHGTPDWADVAPKTTVYGGIDLAELAARLGSIVSFDRRGDVVFLDNFEDGLAAWALGYTDPADIPVWSALYARRGGFSCRLNTSATHDYRSHITLHGPPIIVSRAGLEYSFSLPLDNTKLEGALQFYDGTTRAYYAVRYNQPEEALKYYDTLGNWHTFATGVKLRWRPYLFHNSKMVVDLGKVEFVRLIVDNVFYDMKGLIPWHTGSTDNPLLQAQIALENVADEAKEVYIDTVIITQNEP